MSQGTHDPFIYDALQSHPNLAGAIIWDIGAHVGYHTLGFARLVGTEGRVVAFEPSPANRERLALHVKNNPVLQSRITVRPEALSSNDGDTTLYMGSSLEGGDTSGSFIEEAQTPLERSAYHGFISVPVRQTRGDTLVEKGLIPSPDFMKIDVEGAEFEVLAGCMKLIESKHPVLFIEVHNVTVMHEVETFLFPRGYRTSILESDPHRLSRCFLMGVAGG